MKKLNIKTRPGLKLKLFLIFFLIISAIFPIESSYAAQYQGTARAIVQIGTVSSNCPQGWATTGSITQGPMGRTSHGDTPPPVLYGDGWLEAIDIGTPIGTPVYATVSGTVKNVDTSRGNLDQRIEVTPNCQGLSVVYYWHLSEVSVVKDQTVLFAQQIGLSGLEGTGAHTHYQFNPAFDRSYSISDPPHVPVFVPRYCDPDPCGITITSAP
jgi:murein DD-endopeptidase MepM/ murein hydrolase activator NlpD